MRTYTTTSGEEPDKNSELKAERRAAAADRRRRASRRPPEAKGPGPAEARWQGRELTVRGVLREKPDVRKLARAAIQIALAEAEAKARAEDTSQKELE